MAKVVFHEKPGCGNNTKQKTLLAAAGHVLDVSELRTAPWTETGLQLHPLFFAIEPSH